MEREEIAQHFAEATHELVRLWVAEAVRLGMDYELINPTTMRAPTPAYCREHGTWMESDARDRQFIWLIHGDPESEARRRFYDPLILDPFDDGFGFRAGLPVAEVDAWIAEIHKYEAVA